MVKLRGIGERGNRLMRDATSQIRKAGYGKQLFNAIKSGKSLTAIKRDMEANGISVGSRTLKRTVLARYGEATLGKYFDTTEARYGPRSGLNLTRVTTGDNIPEVRVRVVASSKNRDDFVFDVYVKADKAKDLEEIRKSVEEIYEKDDRKKKSPIKVVKVIY